MRCDVQAVELYASMLECFNPYWVFQCVAIKPTHKFCIIHLKVSIPIGFSNALRYWRDDLDFYEYVEFQSLLGFPMRCDQPNRSQVWWQRQGFNPYWVFQCVAITVCLDCCHTITWFQSLLGFPMRCDLALQHSLPTIKNVSIPIGFSNALRLYQRQS